MKTEFFLSCLLVFLLLGTIEADKNESLGVSKHTLAKTTAAMKPGQWKRFESKGFNRELLMSGGKSIMAYCNKAAWDIKTQTVHYIGMYHLTPPAKHIQFSAKTNTWEGLSGEDWYKTNKWFHAYDNSTAGNGIFYHNFWGQQVWAYTIDTKKWAELPKPPKAGSHGASLTFFPDMGNAGSLVHLHGNKLQILDLETKSWRAIIKKAKGAGRIGTYHNVSMYNPKRKTVIFGGGNGSKFLFELDAKENISAVKECPVMIGSKGSMSVFVIDPASGDLLVSPKINNTLYAYNLSAQNPEWKQIPDAKLKRSIVCALEGLGVTLWFSGKGVWLYKHKPLEN
ncbi:MAG: hypothetical protein COA79_12530 [Planctomycetota bacterium]|nr:MAG: hypothetical protein COA79_12530 [Planctomycetota bacterium]